MDDLKKYHKTYYAPNNAVVVIAGDVKVAQVKALAEQYFEPIPAQPEPRKVHTVEPEQKGERRVYAEKKSVTTPNIMMGYHVPEPQHADHYALDILSDILSTGESSRLHKALINEQQLASNLFTYFPNSLDPNLFYISAVAAKDVTVEKLEQAIIFEVNQVIKHGVTEHELQKVKKHANVNN